MIMDIKKPAATVVLLALAASMPREGLEGEPHVEMTPYEEPAQLTYAPVISTNSTVSVTVGSFFDWKTLGPL